MTIGTAVANLTRVKCRVQVVRSLTPGITLAFSVWLLKKSATKEAIGYAGHPCFLVLFHLQLTQAQRWRLCS